MDQVDTPKSFFACLFDFSFSDFLIPKIIKILYIIAIVLAAIGALMILIGGLAGGSVASGLGAIVVSPVLFILYVIGARIWLELILVVFRIAENTGMIAAQGRTGQAEGSAVAEPSVEPPQTTNELDKPVE